MWQGKGTLPQRPRKRRRDSLRLKGFDYSSEGYYFVTVSCKGKKACFGNEKARKILESQLFHLEKRFDVSINCHATMPDHVHFILALGESKQVSLSRVVQAFKSLVAKELREKVSGVEKFWQRGFYDHIIRNEKDYLEKKRYILNNPLREKLSGRN